MDKPTYEKLKADGPLRINSVQQHKLINDEKSVQKTRSIEVAIQRPLKNTNACMAEERSAFEAGESMFVK